MEKFTWYPFRLKEGLKIKSSFSEVEFTLGTIWTKENGLEWLKINDSFSALRLGNWDEACAELQSGGYYPAEEAQNANSN